MTPDKMPVMVIPSLEPDDRLPAYAERLREVGFRQIVVVNDGSGPDYLPVYRRLEEMGCTVLTHEVNRGKGAGLKTAYAWIREHVPDCAGVITADSDGQHTVEDCLRLAERLAEGEDALYLGSRDFSLEHVPPKSRFGNRMTSVVFRLFHGVWLPDTQTGLRAFRAEHLPLMMEVRGDRYEYEMNVLIECAHRKLKMVPVTIETVYENGNEGTHFHPVRDSWRIYKVILRRFLAFAGASLFCVLLDQGLAAVLREWLLPAMGMTDAVATGTDLVSGVLRVSPLIMWSGYIARAISSVVNFFLNKDLVFRLRSGAALAAVKYFILVVACVTASNLLVDLLARAGVAAWLGKMMADTVLYFVNFGIQQRWVFREKGAAT